MNCVGLILGLIGDRRVVDGSLTECFNVIAEALGSYDICSRISALPITYEHYQ